MNDYSLLNSAAPAKVSGRSMGVKLIVVCALALLMTIPALFVSGLVDDRTKRADEVVKEVSYHVGGPQTFLGPTLMVPYSIPASDPRASAKHGVYLVFPAQASAVVKTVTEERHRSLFKVPVFQADLKMDAQFDLAGVPSALPSNAELDWSRAEIVVGVSDARGALSGATVNIGGKTDEMVPSRVATETTLGCEQPQCLKLTLLGARLSSPPEPNAQFTASSELRFSGAQRIAILPYGKTTHLSMEGDWANPGFDGGFLPARRGVSPTGFNAEWDIPFIARGVRAEGQMESLNGLFPAALAVSFIEVADPYQSVNRSLKYVLLFLGLIFVSYFVFEVTAGKRVHPAQYVLVGIAQTIFYLLLLSLAERLGFDLGFLIAGAATVILLSLNAAWVFASRPQGARALGIFTLLYTLIYMLLRLEDKALMVGGIASFVAVATAMYLTRRIDWYGSMPMVAAPGAVPPSDTTQASS